MSLRQLAAWCFALLCLLAFQPASASASKAEKVAKPWLRRHTSKVSELKVVSAPSQAHDEADLPAPVATAADEDSIISMPAQPESIESSPQLPAVSTMLGSASETLKSIEAEVSQVEVLEPVKMTKTKAQLENKLRKQEEENRAIIAENGRISTNITSLKSRNEKLRAQAKDLQDENHLMRTELHTLEEKIGMAKEFIASSLKSTDDHGAHDLDVLGGNSKPAPEAQEAPLRKRQRHGFIQIVSADSDDDSNSEEGIAADGADGGDDSNDAGLSLLALSSRARRAAVRASMGETAGSSVLADMWSIPPPVGQTPAVSVPVVDEKQLIQGLSSRVVELAKEEKASEMKLQAIFKTDHEAGVQRHEALLAQQKHLKATRKSLRELKVKLTTAVGHLQATKKHLDMRLHGLGLFVQKIAHVLLAPASEAPELLESLPSEVALTEKL